MTMKKILAGVLSAATVLSLSATAFAAPAAPDTTKAVTKPGETEYEAGVGMMGAELDVELPSAMKAFINPYGAVVAVEDGASAATSGEGIVSWAYEVVNNTTDFGIMVDVKTAKATVGTGLTLNAPGSVSDGTSATDKQVALVLQAGNTAAEATKYDNTKIASAAATVVDQGIFVFAADAASKSKVAYAPAKSGQTAGKVYLGITGEINKQYSDGGNTEDLEWTEDDTITATYTLKINPSAKNALDALLPTHSAAVKGLLTNADLAPATDFGATATVGLTAGDTAGTSYTIACQGATNGKKITVDLTNIIADGWAIKTGSGTSCTITGNKIEIAAGAADVTATVVLEKAGETDVTVTIILDCVA